MWTALSDCSGRSDVYVPRSRATIACHDRAACFHCSFTAILRCSSALTAVLQLFCTAELLLLQCYNYSAQQLCCLSCLTAVLQLFCAVALLSQLDDFDNLALLLQFYSYSALQLCCLSLTTLTTLLAETTYLRMSLTNSLKWLTLTALPSLLQSYFCSFTTILRCCSAV